MKMFHRVALAAGAAVIALVPASANHSWNGYHWASDGTPALKVNTAITSQWNSSVGTAISDWNRNPLSLTSATKAVDPKKCSPIAGQILVCNAAYGKRGWLGIASIWLSNGHISQATTKLNDSYHNSAPYNSAAWRALVACQEIGHDFGLDHQDENFNNANLGSCMDYTSDPDGPPSNEHPNQHDFDQITTIYSHLDSTTTVGALLPQGAPSAMSDLSLDGPGQWGRLVSSTRNGRGQTYELDFGRGHKIVTHVFWADPDRDRQ